MKKSSSTEEISEKLDSEKTTKVTKSSGVKNVENLDSGETVKTTSTKTTRRSRAKKVENLDSEETVKIASTKATKTSRTKKSKNIFNLTLNNDENLLEISLNENTYDIYVSNDQYHLFLGKDASSFSSTQQNLKLVNKSINLTILKEGNSFTISTNSNIDFANNINFSNFSKNGDIISFNINNPFRIYSESDKVSLTNETYSNNNVLTNISIPSDSNDTLIISEEDSKVYLPYTSEEVMKKFEVNPTKYDSVTDLIEKEYILPNTLFKHPVRARFREAYKLMRLKEHSSFVAALELAVELMFESHLNPAIITACKSLQELDIYLDCLDDNELDKFTCFKIVYKTLPITV